MRRRLTRTSAPAAVAVSTADMKTFLKVDHSDDDDLIDSIVSAATEQLDGERGLLGRALITQTWRLTLDDFPCDTWANRHGSIWLPLPPLQSITSINYTDIDGNSQTVATSVYDVDTDSEPGRVFLKSGQSWPSVKDIPNAVQITFVAGYGDAASDIPSPILLAIKNLALRAYDLRAPVLTGTIATELPWGLRQLISPYRL